MLEWTPTPTPLPLRGPVRKQIQYVVRRGVFRGQEMVFDIEISASVVFALAQARLSCCRVSLHYIARVT